MLNLMRILLYISVMYSDHRKGNSNISGAIYILTVCGLAFFLYSSPVIWCSVQLNIYPYPPQAAR